MDEWNIIYLEGYRITLKCTSPALRGEITSNNDNKSYAAPLKSPDP